MSKSFILCEKYAPTEISELILPSAVKQKVDAIVESGNIPHLMLSGTPGCGKTQTIKTICKALDAQVMFVNGSDEGRSIDFARNNIQAFATTPSVTKSGRKVVIFDEFDNATKDVELLLRGLIEKCQITCSFCFTCNYINRVEPAIISRTTPIDFNIPKEEKKAIAGAFFKRLMHILDTEEIQYSKDVLIELIIKHFGNWRHIINICQGYAGSKNVIDVGVLGNITSTDLSTLFNYLKTKRFDKTREWLATYVSNDPHKLVRMIYDSLTNYVENNSIPIFVTILAKYEYQMKFDTDPEIQLLSALTEAMTSCNFK